MDAVETTMRLCGYVYIFDSGTDLFVRHSESRTRIFSLLDGIHVINVLSEAADIEKMRYVFSDSGKLTVTDETSFSLDVNEFGVYRWQGGRIRPADCRVGESIGDA